MFNNHILLVILQYEGFMLNFLTKCFLFIWQAVGCCSWWCDIILGLCLVKYFFWSFFYNLCISIKNFKQLSLKVAFSHNCYVVCFMLVIFADITLNIILSIYPLIIISFFDNLQDRRFLTISMKSLWWQKWQAV